MLQKNNIHIFILFNPFLWCCKADITSCVRLTIIPNFFTEMNKFPHLFLLQIPLYSWCALGIRFQTIITDLFIINFNIVHPFYFALPSGRFFTKILCTNVITASTMPVPLITLFVICSGSDHSNPKYFGHSYMPVSYLTLLPSILHNSSDQLLTRTEQRTHLDRPLMSW